MTWVMSGVSRVPKETRAEGEGGSGQVQHARSALSGIQIAAIELCHDAVAAGGERFGPLSARQRNIQRHRADGFECVFTGGIFEILHMPDGHCGLKNIVVPNRILLSRCGERTNSDRQPQQCGCLPQRAVSSCFHCCCGGAAGACGVLCRLVCIAASAKICGRRMAVQS